MGVSKVHADLVPVSPGLQHCSKRRKLDNHGSAADGKSMSTAIDLTSNDDDFDLKKPSPRPRKTPQRQEQKDAEKRLRQLRVKPPKTYLDRLERAESQRMFILDRKRQGTAEVPEEVFRLAGTTGNVYSVTIDKMPRCTCPDNVKGNQCKHIIYVVCNVLKATGRLRYQLAYLSSELHEIFEGAPRPTEATHKETESGSNRKPIDGDCPICFMELESSGEDVLYCKAGCGNNVHEVCFQQWARCQGGKEVRCVYCRTPWEGDHDSLAALKRALEAGRTREINHEGYVNVANELGISDIRGE